MASHRVQQWATFARTWWIYDAKAQCPFLTTKLIVPYLIGSHKPISHGDAELGDHVVIFNTRHISMPEDRWRTWKHFSHSGYRSGFKAIPAYKVHENFPTKILEKQIYASMKNGLVRRSNMVRLHLYPDEDIPDKILKNVTAQIRQVMHVPKSIEDFTMEEQANFPKLFDWPKEYVKTPRTLKEPTE